MKRLLNLLKGKAPAAPLPPPQADTPFSVVGDLHGCAALMDKLLSRLPGADEAHLVFVGDYIDRGDDSAGVLRRLADLRAAHGDRVICLKGNHEDMLLKFLDDPEERGQRFLRYGGLQTLASFSIGGVSERSTGMELVTARNRLRDAMGSERISLLKGLQLQWSSGNITVVHAAADPDLPMDEQDSRTLMWGHPDFLKQARSDGTWIAHGHTIIDSATIAGGRIAVDTGAYATGRLSAVHAGGSDIRVITTD